MTSPRPTTTRLLFRIAGLSLLMGALVAAVGLTFEATEERAAETAALDLHLAVLNVTGISTTPEEESVDAELFESWVDELRSDHAIALHALAPAERTRAENLIAQVVEHCEIVNETPGSEHPAPPRAELNSLLALASERAAVDARTASRLAMGAIGTAAFVTLCFSLLSLFGWQRRSRERDLEQTQLREGQRIERLLDDSPDMVFVLDADGRITYQSASCDELLRMDQHVDQTAVEALAAMVDPADSSRLRDHLTAPRVSGSSAVFGFNNTASDELRWVNVRVSDHTTDDLVRGHLVTAIDVSAEIQLRKELSVKAETDHLTGLPNRRQLDPTLDDFLDRSVAYRSHLAVVSIDLDGFKEVNDTLGHAAGDELLVQIARRLENALDPADRLLRLGGDEFAVVCPTVANAEEAIEVGQRLLATFEQPIRISDSRMEYLRASIGVAVSEVTSDGVEADLVGQADMAMYHAKKLGLNEVVLFEPLMEEATLEAARITRALRTANYDEEFHLVFQPIVGSSSLEIASLEALLRWNSPTLGPIGPDKFIPIAEASGEICTIGRWVLDAVCAQLSKWIDEGLEPGISVSFNVSARQLADDRFIDGVFQAVRAWRLPPERLVIEVTETSVLDHSGPTINRLRQLRAAGFGISIDDFGSGYSNLGQLLMVPFDTIKIDRSLLLTLSSMREMSGDDPTNPCQIMEAIVSIATVMGAPVVCEGVETEVQRISLARSGLTYVQGYLTGRPMPPEDLRRVLALEVHDASLNA